MTAVARVFPGITPQVIRTMRLYEWWAFAQEAKKTLEQERTRNHTTLRGARRGR